MPPTPADDPTDDSKFFRRAGPKHQQKNFSATSRSLCCQIFSLLRRLAPPKMTKKRKNENSKILCLGRMIFAIFARFLKSYTGFDVKISFPNVFCFRCTDYEPRATENRPIDGRIGGGGWSQGPPKSGADDNNPRVDDTNLGSGRQQPVDPHGFPA